MNSRILIESSLIEFFLAHCWIKDLFIRIRELNYTSRELPYTIKEHSNIEIESFLSIVILFRNEIDFFISKNRFIFIIILRNGFLI